jgi:hypothetical protein
MLAKLLKMLLKEELAWENPSKNAEMKEKKSQHAKNWNN